MRADQAFDRVRELHPELSIEMIAQAGIARGGLPLGVACGRSAINGQWRPVGHSLLPMARVGSNRPRAVASTRCRLVILEQRVAADLFRYVLAEFETGEPEETDGLGELRRHHERL